MDIGENVKKELRAKENHQQTFKSTVLITKQRTT